MAADVVNLNRARKAKARAEKDNKAAENRARFGRTKFERVREGATKKRMRRELDGKKVDKGSDGPETA